MSHDITGMGVHNTKTNKHPLGKTNLFEGCGLTKKNTASVDVIVTVYDTDARTYVVYRGLSNVGYCYRSR